MAASLLPMKNGSCSLEFATSDIDRVSILLREHFGVPRVEKWPELTVYKFKQADLLFQNEWDDPCLIASTAEGIAMLEVIAKDMAGQS
jgi:hypothetical protein